MGKPSQVLRSFCLPLFGSIIFQQLYNIADSLVADGVLRGSGMMDKFMIATFTGLVIRVALAILLARTPLGATGIWCAWPVGWSITAVCPFAFYRRGAWSQRPESDARAGADTRGSV